MYMQIMSVKHQEIFSPKVKKLFFPTVCAQIVTFYIPLIFKEPQDFIQHAESQD